MMQTWITSVAQLIQKLFNANVLSVSDEAFLLLVLINGGARWMSEINESTERYVFVLTDEEAMQLFTHTFVQCSQNNGTWTEDQELSMPVGVMNCIA